MTDTIARRVGYGLTQGLCELDPLPIIVRRAPTASDLKYPIGQIWINQLLDDAYMLTSVAAGAAHWEVISANTPGSAPTTKFVVDSDGTAGYLTIQAGIDAAFADGGGVVYIRPGVYTENLTLYTNIVLQGAGLETTITGVHTPPDVGIVSFFDCSLTSGTDIVTSAAAGVSRIIFFNCQINCTNGYVADLPNWTGRVDLFSCESASTTDGVVRVSAATVIIKDSTVGNGATALSITGGTLVVMGSRIECPISPAGACAASITQGSYIGGMITTAGTTALLVANSTISSGAAAALTQSSAGAVTLSNVTITTVANPAIAGAGAGTVTLANVTFTSARNLVGTLTLAHVDEVRLDKLVCGDTTYRTSPFSSDNNIIGAYGITTGGVVGTTYRAIRGDLQQDIGNGTESPQAIRGSLTCLTGSNTIEGYGMYGAATQNDGAAVVSNLIGVLGLTTVNEVNPADQPQQWIAGSQSIVWFDAAAGVPTAAIVCANLNHVMYDAAMNTIAHGVVVSRNGGGAGGPAGAAFKVVIGGGIDDWQWGVDLYTGSLANNYSVGDIRLAQQNLIKSVAGFPTGAVAPGSIAIRSDGSNADGVLYVNHSGGATAWRPVLRANTTWIEHFTQSPIMQSNVNTGAAPTGATGDINLMCLQGGEIMQQFILGAGQTIIAPRMDAVGLLVSLDLVVAEGAEYNWGMTPISKHAYTIGTSPAFTFIMSFAVADVTGAGPILMGFRKQEANNASFAAYTDFATIGLDNAINPGTVIIETRLNSGAVTTTNTTNAWGDGANHTLRIDVSAAGVVTFGIDGAAPVVTQAFTFDNGDVVSPYFHILHAAVAPGAIEWTDMVCGPQ